MKRSAILKLRENVWRDVEGGDGLRIEVKPDAAKLVMDTFPQNEKMICQKAFVGFDGYTEDDGETKVPNTLKTRMELFDWINVRNAVGIALRDAQESIQQGEDTAASD